MKKIMAFTLSLMLLGFIVACSDDSSEEEGIQEDTVIATVNGEEVLGKEFNEMVAQYKVSYTQEQSVDFQSEEGLELLAQIENHVLETLIQQEVLLQASTENDLLATDEQISEEMEAIQSQFDSTEEYEAALKASGFTESSFQEMLMLEMSIENYLYANIDPVDEVTEEEKESLYEQVVMQYEAQGQEAPDYEEIEEMLEAQVIEQKEQQQMQVVVQDTMENADIERLI